MTIRIPDGNAFRIRLTARNLISGEYTEAADLSNIDNLVINYVRRGIRFPHAYTIDEEGRATVADAGTLDCGFYGIELTGYYGGEKFRFYGKDLFEITTDTTNVIDPSNLIDIEITVKLNASGVSKDYVDHAINGMETSMETMQADLRDEIAEAGKVDDVKVNGVSVVSGKKANITVPTKVSDLTNDSGYQNEQQVQQKVDAAKITSADISVDGGTGTPSGSAGVSGNKLVIALHNIKGQKGDTGESIVGPQGPQGDSFQPIEDVSGLVLAHTTGIDNTKAMSQKGVTDALTYKYDVVNLDYEYFFDIRNAYVSSAAGKWKPKGNTNYKSQVIPIKPGETYVVYPSVQTKIAVLSDYRGLGRSAEANAYISVAEGFTGGITCQPEGYEFVSPHDGRYLYLTRQESDGTPITWEVLRKTTIKQGLDLIENPLDKRKVKTNWNQGGLAEWWTPDYFSLTDNANSSKKITSSVIEAKVPLLITPSAGYYYEVYSDPTTSAAAITHLVSRTDQPSYIRHDKQISIVVLKSYDGGVNYVDITPEEGDAALSIYDLTADVESVEKKIEDSTVHKESLFLGTLARKGLLFNGTLTEDERPRNAAMVSQCILPYSPIDIKVTLPSNYVAGLSVGAHTSDTAYNQGNVGAVYCNGQTIHVPAGMTQYRVNIIRSDADMNLEEMYQLIEDGKVKFEYNSPRAVKESYPSGVMAARAAAYRYVNGQQTTNMLNNLPLFVHTSDIHGDATRYERFLQFAEDIGALAAINTGDMCNTSMKYGTQYFHDLHAKHPNLTALVCVGNHDVAKVTNAVTDMFPNATDAEVFRDIIEPEADRYNYLLSEGVETTKNYYYYDFVDANVRVIALYTYEEGKIAWSHHRITQEQIEWFIDTLASTPAGYGVMVIYHQSEKELVPLDGEGLDAWNDTPTQSYYYRGMTGSPICDVIDAFIAKGEASGSYTCELGNGTTAAVQSVETVNWSADFRNVDESTEFICHVTGHLHYDFIGKMKETAQTQLVLNVISGMCAYATGGACGYGYSNHSAIPRYGNDATADSFNAFAIDRANGTVRIARVGANVTTKMYEKKMIVVPYKD